MGTTQAIQQGMRVALGTPLFDLADLDRIKAVAHVEEADLYQLREGMPVPVRSDGFADVTLQGHIASIGMQGISQDAYGGAATYEVVVLVNPLTSGQRAHVRLGMSAQLEVITYHAERSLAVPAEALRRDEWVMLVVYRRDVIRVPESIRVSTGRTVPQGVEIIGMPPGYVELPD